MVHTCTTKNGEKGGGKGGEIGGRRVGGREEGSREGEVGVGSGERGWERGNERKRGTNSIHSPLFKHKLKVPIEDRKTYPQLQLAPFSVHCSASRCS